MQTEEEAEIRKPRYTAREVAQSEKVSIRTVHNWYEQGVIPAKYHVGRVLRFDLDDVREALERHSKSATSG